VRRGAEFARVDFDTATPAVVLKVQPNIFHHGGLGAIRSLGRLGVEVYGLREDRLTPLAGSRYLRGRSYPMPDSGEPDAVLAVLDRLAGRIGRPAVLVPADDAAAVLISERADDLRPRFLLPAPPPGLPGRLAGKYTMYQLCRKLGVPTVAVAMPESVRDAEEFLGLVGLPLMAKVTRPWALDKGARLNSTTMVRRRSELVELFERYDRASRATSAEERRAGLMLQEYIPASPPDTRPGDWFFHGYADAWSRCVVGFTGVKVRSYPPHAGQTSFGYAEPNERLRPQAEDLVARLSYRGIMDLDYRWDPRDDQYKLLDFNPRIGAQFPLFVDDNGIDVVRAQHLDLTGRRVPKSSPVTERSFVVENYDPIAALGYRRRGELDLRDWLRSWRHVDETAWFARDDIVPFGLMCLRMGWRAVERPIIARRASVLPSMPSTPTTRVRNHVKEGIRQ
jgi:D-aspartate ligase